VGDNGSVRKVDLCEEPVVVVSVDRKEQGVQVEDVACW
jgi:hypothetical protein